MNKVVERLISPKEDRMRMRKGGGRQEKEQIHRDAIERNNAEKLQRAKRYQYNCGKMDSSPQRGGVKMQKGKQSSSEKERKKVACYF